MKEFATRPRLEVEMVPRTCFYSNLRSNLPSKEWQKLRKIAIEKAGARCEICGSLNQGKSLECHEIWYYDELTYTQILTGVIALCRTCHSAKHLALARKMGWEDSARRQLMRVNRWTPSQLEQYIVEAFVLFEERSQHEWKLDVQLLTLWEIDIPARLDRC